MKTVLIKPSDKKEAEGFHFMEQSYGANIEMFKKYGMVIWKNILRVPKGKFFCMEQHTWFETLKENIDPYLGKIQPPLLRKVIFTVLVIQRLYYLKSAMKMLGNKKMRRKS